MLNRPALSFFLSTSDHFPFPLQRVLPELGTWGGGQDWSQNAPEGNKFFPSQKHLETGDERLSHSTLMSYELNTCSSAKMGPRIHQREIKTKQL